MIQRWDRFVTSQRTGSLFQTSLWPHFFNPMTNHWIYFYGEEDNNIRLTALIRGRRTPWWGLNYTILRGPVCDDESGLILGIREMVQALEKEKVVRLTLNPYWDYPAGEEVEVHLKELGFTVHKERQGLHCQTVAIDLNQSIDELFQKCRKTTRYEMKRSQKLGIMVTRAETEEAVSSFYGLLTKMGRNKDLRIPSLSFFNKMWKSILKHQHLGVLLMSYFQNRLLSGIIILRHGDRAVYSWGASEKDVAPNVPKNHLAIWKGILWAREKGCRLFDMGGYTGTLGNDLMGKIDLFKKGFGGDISQLVQSHQFVFKKEKE